MYMLISRFVHFPRTWLLQKLFRFWHCFKTPIWLDTVTFERFIKYLSYQCFNQHHHIKICKTMIYTDAQNNRPMRLSMQKSEYVIIFYYYYYCRVDKSQSRYRDRAIGTKLIWFVWNAFCCYSSCYCCCCWVYCTFSR